MKAALQLNLSQQVNITPQLQQAIRLLQLSTLDLNHEIQEILDTNPLLEAVENNSKELAPEQNWKEYCHNEPIRKVHNNEDFNFDNLNAAAISLQDHLHWQLELTPFSEIDHAIAVTLIDAINPNGFLSTTITDIHQSLVNENNLIEPDEVLAVLHRIQRFDPIGCGAQNLSECLLIQLSQLPQTRPDIEIIRTIIRDNIDMLAQHQYVQLRKIYHLTESQLQTIIECIQSLNPRPGTLIESARTEYLTPDISAIKVGNKWIIQLNHDTLPKLSINQQYATMIQRADNSTDNTYLKNNLQEAKWFLKSLESRQETLFKVASCIVDYQQEFLEHGAEAMKPMVLTDVANKLGLHESTVSRVTTQKYIYTPQGIFELKYFFSSHVTTNAGGECSSTAIRAVIKKLITAENPQKPLSDSKVAQLIGMQGIKVARRTIAKYREAMGIAPSNERKSV